jgi:hypothetical protein
MALALDSTHLVAAREALIARMGDIDIDGAYQAEISTFRGAVTDIAATPEGLTALAASTTLPRRNSIASPENAEARQVIDLTGFSWVRG